jgi:hypothetical protein
VELGEEQQAALNKVIDGEIQEQTEADKIEQDLNTLDEWVKTTRVAMTWGFPENRTGGYRSFVDKIKGYRHHEGKVIDVAEWADDFAADLHVEGSPESLANRRLAKPILDAIHMESRKVVASIGAYAAQEELDFGSPEEVLGFVMDPSISKQTVEAIIIPEYQSGPEPFELLSPKLVETPTG